MVTEAVIQDVTGNVIEDVVGVGGGGLVDMLKVTGQTTSYKANDDGDLQIGIPISWTLLTTGQYAGTTNVTVGGKQSTIANTCAVDNVYELMWTREAPTSFGVNNDGRILWAETFEYATQANIQLLGGWGDWRVPNIFELHALLVAKDTPPFVDETVFYNIAAFAQSWSSTTDPLNSLDAIVQVFNNVIYAPIPKTFEEATLLVRTA